MGVEYFERAAEAGAQLLKVDSRAEDGDASRLAVVLFTFDVGRILVQADGRIGELAIEVVPAGAPLPAGLADAQEEEPWWRLLGSPLARVWQPEGGLRGGVCLQFRADDASPRIVTLETRGASVSVRLENPPA